MELGDHAIVVRPTSRAVTPLAERFRELAPASLRIVSRRPALGFELAVKRAPRFERALSAATARAGFTRGHLLEIIVNLPGATGSEAESAAVELLVWDVLGERLADDWVGAVAVVPAPRGGPLKLVAGTPEQGFALRDLKMTVDAAVAGVGAGLPEKPHFAAAANDEWTLFELDPEPSDEDFAFEDDLAMASTCVPEALKCHLEQRPFSSVRFSRHGELFFYLKYAERGAPETRLKRRVLLEDQLDSALVAARLGRVVGGGLGLRYSYVHFALAEAERAVAIICDIAKSQKLAKRSWVLPFDTDLAAEWAEVWPAAPPPPRPASESGE